MLTVNTKKTWRWQAIFLYKKNFIEHLVFRHVYRSFPGRIKSVFVGGFWESKCERLGKLHVHRQTSSFHARKEIKTIQSSNFPNAVFIRIAELISRINIFYYSKQFLADVTPYFLRAVQFSFGLLCRALLVVINHLISKHKQHTFTTFPQAFDMLAQL